MSDNKFLNGKVSLIAGAGSGFGREMAIAFAENGSSLVLNDINMAGLEETRDLILKNFPFTSILLAQADISKIQEAFFQGFPEVDQALDFLILVNNAGIDGGAYKSLSSLE